MAGLLAGGVAFAAPSAAVGQDGGPSAASARPPRLPSLEAVVNTPPLDGVQWGILAMEAGSGRVLHELDAGKRFIPGSNRKVLVAAAALSLLGPDHRWVTGLYAAGPVRNGVLEGDLVLPGTGDPTLGEPFHRDGTTALEALADSLKGAGVHRVTGALVVDASRWDSTSVPESWMVEDLHTRFGASGGAFAIGAGEVEVRVLAGRAAGEEPQLRWGPVGRGDFIRSEVITGSTADTTRIRSVYHPEGGFLLLTGVVRAGEDRVLRLAMRDPVGQAAMALHRILGERGIPVEGGVRVVWTLVDPGGSPCSLFSRPADPCPSLPRLAALTSPPLGEVVAVILQPSQNWITEQVVRTLGSEFGTGGSWDEGLRVEREWLMEVVGVDSLDLAFRDGSGMSAQNLVTPRALVQTLDHMRRSPHGILFRDALAAPGAEGTLRHRLPQLEGRLAGKTGSLTHVNTLSGYLVREDGTEVIFAILSNASGLPASMVRQALDRMVLALSRGPSPLRGGAAGPA